MATPCMSDDGYTRGEKIRLEGVEEGALIRKAAAVANAIDNANQLIKNRRKQRRISDRAMKISEEEQQHLETVFWPREIQFLAEFGTPEQLETAEALGRRYAGRMVSSVAGAFAKRFRDVRCQSSRYCTSAKSKAMQDLAIARAQAIANAKVMGRLAGFAEVMARSDRDWKRRMQAVGLKQGLMQEAARLYTAAGKGLAEAGTEIAGRLNNALEMYGFADRDPGRSQQMNSIIRNDRYNARMPGVIGGQVTQAAQPTYNSFNPVAEFNAVTDSTQFNSDVSAGVPVNDQSIMNPSSPYMDSIQENQMNKGRMGNWDLSRNGSKTYTAIDSHGDRVAITVNMDDFKLVYTDNKTQGDT